MHWDHAVLTPFTLKTAFTSVWKPTGKHRAAGTALPFQPGIPQRWSRAGPGPAEFREAMTGKGAGCSLCFRLNDPLPFYCKSVGIQGGKGTFPKWIQNTYYQTVNWSQVINGISVQERKSLTISTFLIHEWQFFFFRQICQQDNCLNKDLALIRWEH